MSRTTAPAPADRKDGATAPAEGLTHGLKQRHLSMIALGGVIGAGLFVGSGAGIAAAGPSIVIAYAISGILVMLVMRMLGEMSAANPASGSFSVHAERALGLGRLHHAAGPSGSCSASPSAWRASAPRRS